MRRTDRLLVLLLPVPALLWLATFLAGPILGAAWTSLHRDTPFSPRTWVGLDHYVRFFRDEQALESLEFTFLFVAVSVLAEVVLGLLVALAIHPAFPGRGWVRAAVLVPWAMPPVVAAVLWKFLLNDQYGFVNYLVFGADLQSYAAWLAEPWSARAAIVLADVWKTTSFAALLILAGLQSIPAELHEAARVDGAGAARRFFLVTLPLLRPALLLALLFRTADAFRVFDLVYVMTGGAPGGSTSVLSFFGYQKMFPEQQLGYGSAVSMIVFLLVGVTALLLLRVVGSRLLERAA